MAKPSPPDYVVVKDTREQKGYWFSNYDKCGGMVDRKLDTGDYSIEGFEDVLCIERKASVSEIANNMGKKKDSFHREIERMDKFRFPFLICEFSLDDVMNFPEGSDIPLQKRQFMKISPKYLLKCFMDYQVNYNVKVLFCGNKDNAFRVVNSLCKRVNQLMFEELADNG